jgi:MFS family permease
VLASINRGVKDYGGHLLAFRPNARLYLVYVIIAGVSMGIYQLVFNWYILSLGYDAKLIGNLASISGTTALVFALPMGYLAESIGRKNALLLSAVLVSFSIGMMVIWPATPIFYAMNILSGIAQSLAAVTMAPFLMENSGEHERTYLFSFSSGIQTLAMAAGNWIGGYISIWSANLWKVSPGSSQAYGASIMLVAIGQALAIMPLILIKMPRLARSERTVFAPFSYATKNPKKLTKLILPMLITSIGAGLIMPFMNVFFRFQYHQPDQVIGSVMAWGLLAMGLGLIAAPVLADRFGKIQVVVISQALSIPFLVLLGFSPLFWMSGLAYLVRVALMNMSTPVYTTFVMEHVEAESRAMVASLVSMAWSFGRVISPTISGNLQVKYGFGPPFLGTIILYLVSVFMYWFFWWCKGDTREEVYPEAVTDG